MPIHILIVDDDEDDRVLLSDGIKAIDQSIVCTHASNGEEALKLLRSNDGITPHYIFLDLNMPRLNGKQTLIELKKCNNLCNIPVVIYTTSKLKDDKTQTKNLGAVHFITKPSSAIDLEREILFVLSRSWEVQIQEIRK